MSAAAVVDASVAIKWVIEEPFSAQAQALYENAVSAHELLLAPPHLPSEVVNALYRRMLRRDDLALNEEEASGAVSQFLAIPLRILAPASLYDQAFAFAKTYRLPSNYDSLYVTLAHMLATELWTADQRLLNAVRTAAPWIRWIGEYRSSP